MRFSARAAVAYDAVIRKHDISAFGYYWWGERELMTQLRAQSGLAVSRLAAMGRPGVTEGDVKTAMAMKILDLLGGGGMFVEFFAMDFNENSILMGHDGPANINVASGPPRLMHLDTHHGKSGHGLGIDFDMQQGPVTLLNLSQHDAGDTFKLIYAVGEIVPGTILGIGNPNARVRIERPLHEDLEYTVTGRVTEADRMEGPRRRERPGVYDRIQFRFELHEPGGDFAASSTITWTYRRSAA